MSKKRKFSSPLVDGPEQAPSRSMLRAAGFSDEDFNRPQVGVASTWSMVTPCNMHINDLATLVCNSIDKEDLKSVLFNTITISDGISMGTLGMRYSLVSREVIADSIETVVGCQSFDGVVAIGGCDKNMPGCLMGLGRLNRPSIFVYGGSIRPGANHTDLITVMEGVGSYTSKKISEDELIAIEKTALPGPGSCGGMYTANTMASAIEALGMSLPGSSSQDAVSEAKKIDCKKIGTAMNYLLEKDIKPSDIMTKAAFENSIRVIIALGGSTNAVLHLLAMAHTVNVPLAIDDFEKLGKDSPVLADLRPSGHYLMSELNEIGGVQPLMKMLLEEGLLNGECMTVTGKTLEENLDNVKPYPKSQKIISSISSPIKKDSHLRILKGNLAEDGAVAKITGKEGTSFTGTARVFNSEEETLEAIYNSKINPGDVIVVRYEGPVGGPGMREMLKPTSAIMGKGMGDKVAFITDGRFSGGSHGFVVGHITPEAAEGGLIGLLEDGDQITIDAIEGKIDANLSQEEIQKRRKSWRNPKPYNKKGVLSKYAKVVSSASLGAITD
ncbi:dihydroxy-acid dehydratase [SAR86 cluster bacterium]|jgi:dihydroxy-acid dehydratase|nr:dihydroxy-acid dehydratase [SAR86 cluster bacterium]